MKIKVKSLLIASALTCSAQIAVAEENVVHVYNWSDYIDESVLTDFTKETGIKVVYDVFDSNEILETKLLAGGTGYDVVVPSGTFLARQIQAGVFQPLDMSKLPNSKNLWAEIQHRTEAYDPGQKYSINYMWEAEKLPDGTSVCQPMDQCAAGDINADGIVGTPDYEILVSCMGRAVDDTIPPR